MIASGRVHIPVVNTSSVNGFWASIGPHLPQTAYAAAKFAVKGFTEALITDLRINAPHIKCSVVMPGHIWLDPAQHPQGAERQSGGCDGRDAAGASAGALCLDGQRRLTHVGRRHPAAGRRARAPLPRGGADQRRSALAEPDPN